TAAQPFLDAVSDPHAFDLAVADVADRRLPAARALEAKPGRLELELSRLDLRPGFAPQGRVTAHVTATRSLGARAGRGGSRAVRARRESTAAASASCAPGASRPSERR